MTVNAINCYSALDIRYICKQNNIDIKNKKKQDLAAVLLARMKELTELPPQATSEVLQVELDEEEILDCEDDDGEDKYDTYKRGDNASEYGSDFEDSNSGTENEDCVG